MFCCFCETQQCYYSKEFSKVNTFFEKI